MRIETERLIVRPFREEDADALYRIKTDPQVVEFCPDFLEVDVSREDMYDWIKRFRRYEEDGDIDSWRCYAIEKREIGEVAGCLSFCRQKLLHEYDLGWMMIGAYRRRFTADRPRHPRPTLRRKPHMRTRDRLLRPLPPARSQILV